MSRQAAWECYTGDVRRILEAAGDELSEEEAVRMVTEEVAHLRRRRRPGV